MSEEANFSAYSRIVKLLNCVSLDKIRVLKEKLYERIIFKYKLYK